MLDFALSALATLVVVVDPVGTVPAFLAVTHDLPAATRRNVGLRAAILATLVLAGTALAGNWVLDRLGIGLPAFRISGGVLLFAVAFEMVLGIRPAREAKEAEQAIEGRARDIAAFPLAIPLIAGPGALTATLLLAGRTSHDVTATLVLLAIIVLVGLACAAAFLLAPQAARLLGVTGNVVLSRLLGVILAALAVQFVIDGCRDAFLSG